MVSVVEKSRDHFSSYFTSTVKSHSPPVSIDKSIEFYPVSKPPPKCEASIKGTNCTGIQRKRTRVVANLVSGHKEKEEMIYGVISVWTVGNSEA